MPVGVGGHSSPIIHGESGIFVLGTESVGVEHFRRSRRTVFGRKAYGRCVVVVDGPEDILVLSRIQVLVQWNHENVFIRRLVVHLEIVRVRCGKGIAEPLQGQSHLEHFVVVFFSCVNRRVQIQFLKKEPGYRKGESAIILAGVLAHHRRKFFRHLLQFVDDEVENIGPGALLHFRYGNARLLQHRDVAEQVHDIVIKASPECACFSLPFGIVLQFLDCLVGKDDHLVKIVPGVLDGRFGGFPGMKEQPLPQSSVVPVATTCGDNGFVGCEGVQVVDAAVGAGYAFSFGGRTYLPVEITQSVLIQGFF